MEPYIRDMLIEFPNGDSTRTMSPSSDGTQGLVYICKTQLATGKVRIAKEGDPCNCGEGVILIVPDSMAWACSFCGIFIPLRGEELDI